MFKGFDKLTGFVSGGTKIKTNSVFKNIVTLICTILFIVILCGWTIKGWKYLDAKTRDAALNADYTEQLLQNNKD